MVFSKIILFSFIAYCVAIPADRSSPIEDTPEVVKVVENKENPDVKFVEKGETPEVVKVVENKENPDVKFVEKGVTPEVVKVVENKENPDVKFVEKGVTPEVVKVVENGEAPDVVKFVESGETSDVVKFVEKGETSKVVKVAEKENKSEATEEKNEGSFLLGILGGQIQNKPQPIIETSKLAQSRANPHTELDLEESESKISEALISLAANTLVDAVTKDDNPKTTHTKNNDIANFYVITAIFNPASYQSRYDRYHEFAQHMKESGANLITIECIFPSLGQKDFQVTTSSNPLNIQLTSDSVYWVKEDLINIAVKKLPATARWVSWLDADLQFHEANWIQETIKTLEHHSVVQMFKYAHFLNADEEILRTDYSFGYSLLRGKPLLGFGPSDWYPHPGYGWAMSRDTYTKIGGLPNYDIVGGGDLYFAYTLVNHLPDIVEKDFEEDYKIKMIEESENVYKILTKVSKEEGKTIAGFVPVTVSHRWHGDRKDRGYIDRLNILIANDFNYFEDMIRGDNGLLQFGNKTESLQQDLKCYFENRNEDNNKTGPSECNSEEYTMYMATQAQKVFGGHGHGHGHGHGLGLAHGHGLGLAHGHGLGLGNGHENNCHCPVDPALPGHYYGKTYTYYTTQNYHNVLDTKALESIVTLIKKH